MKDELIADMKRFVQLNKEYRELEPLVAAGDRYARMVHDLEAAKEILQVEKDEELREMAKEEVATLEEALPAMEEEIKLLLIPKDPQDEKNAIMEIRGGTGGDEAAIFAGDLFRMYSKFAEKKGWRIEVTSQSEGTSGGFKELIWINHLINIKICISIFFHSINECTHISQMSNHEDHSTCYKNWKWKFHFKSIKISKDDVTNCTDEHCYEAQIKMWYFHRKRYNQRKQ